MATGFALWLPLVGAMAALAALLALAARRLGSGRREIRRAIRWGVVATLAVVGPYVVGARFLTPTGRSAASIPGAPAPRAAVDPYDDQLNDAILQFLPWEIEIRRTLAQGHPPFWSERLDGGSSPWSNPQAQVLSPFALLARAAPLPQFFLVVLALRILTAFAGAALLARRLAIGRPLALAVASSYALGGALAGFSVFPHGGPAALAPWLALALLHRARGGRSGATTAALVAAATCLAGHPVTAAGAVALALLVAALGRRRGLPWTRALGRPAAALALGALLAAPQLLPFARLFAGSARPGEVAARAGEAPLATPWISPATGAVVAAALNPGARFAPAPAVGASRAWLPAVSIYGGLWLWPFAAAGFALPRTRRLARPLLLFALLVLVGALGFAPLVAVKRALPLLATLQLPRLVPAALLALALVAGRAARELLAAPRARAVGLLALASLVSLALAPSLLVSLVWLALLATLVVGGRRPRPAQGAFALAVAIDLLAFAAVALPRGEPADLYPPSPLLARLAGLVEAPGGPWRACGAGYLAYPSLLPAYGIADPRPNDPPLVPRGQALALESTLGFAPVSRAYFSPLARPEHRFLDFLAVRALVAPEALAMPARMRRVDAGEAPGFALWENPAALPLAFLPRRIERVPQAEMSGWLAALDDPRRVAIAYDADPLVETLAVADGESPGVGIERLGSNGYRLTVLGPGTRLAATSLPALPGWSAVSDGRTLETTVVDAGFLAVVVPAGAAVVELAYRPAGFVGGSFAAAAALVALGWSRLARRLDRLRRRARRPPSVAPPGARS